MQVTQNKIPAVKDSKTGAKVGDKILFSPYAEENKKTLAGHCTIFEVCYVTPNKLYTITRITDSKRSVFINDKGTETSLGSEGYRGRYDIIERAPEVQPEFQPVTVILETQGEVDVLAALLGTTTQRTVGDHFEGKPNMFDMYIALDKVATKGRKRLSAKFTEERF